MAVVTSTQSTRTKLVAAGAPRSVAGKAARAIVRPDLVDCSREIRRTRDLAMTPDGQRATADTVDKAR
jgi:hypothetical protein